MKKIIINTIIIIYGLSLYGQDSIIWEFSANSGIYSSPVTDDNNVYFGSNDSILYALDKKQGNLLWKYKTKGEIKSKPLLFKKSIIINSSDGYIYSIDKTEGKVLWTFKTNGEKTYDLWDYYMSSPVIYQDNVYVGSGDSNVYSINAETGKLIWKFKTGGIVHATPVVKEQKIFIGSYDGYFYALDAKSGSLIWKFKTVGDMDFPKGEIQRGAVIYKNSLIFGSRDYNIYALDMNSGRGLWNMKEKGSWIIATPLVYGDNIYFGTSDTHRFYAMNAATGSINWSLSLNMRVYATALSFNNKIFFGCFNGKLFGVDNYTGEIEQTFQTTGSKKNYHTVFKENDDFRDDFQLYGANTTETEKQILELGSILTTPLIDNGIIYFGDANGIFYALQLK